MVFILLSMCERIEHDLIDHRLDGRAVLGVRRP